VTIPETLRLRRRAAVLASTGMGRQRREALSITQQDLAKAIGIRPATLCRWEGGQRVPRGEPAERWVQLLDELAESVA
jgi:transcriptional regulator with XRE-family HTH domain